MPSVSVQTVADSQYVTTWPAVGQSLIVSETACVTADHN